MQGKLPLVCESLFSCLLLFFVATRKKKKSMKHITLSRQEAHRSSFAKQTSPLFQYLGWKLKTYFCFKKAHTFNTLLWTLSPICLIPPHPKPINYNNTCPSTKCWSSGSETTPFPKHVAVFWASNSASSLTGKIKDKYIKFKTDFYF